MLRRLALLLSLPGLLRSCDITQCATDLPPSTCFVNDVSHRTFKISACASGQKCQMDQTSSTLLYDFGQTSYSCVSSDWLPTTKYPGEICTQSSDCLSGHCSSSGRCVGLPQGQPCSLHGDCDVGLVCIGGVSKFCIQQMTEGGRCTQDADCVNSCLCYNAKCSRYLSLLSGSVIGDSTAFLCASGFALQGVCLEAPRNVKAADDPCYNDRECKTVFPDATTGLISCRCGLNTKGLAFCQAVPGDDEFQPFAASMRAILNVNNKCHYDTGFTSRCPELSADSQFQSFLNAYYIFVYRHMVVGAPDCAVSIMPFIAAYSGYTGVLDVEGSSMDKTIIIAVIVCVFTFLIVSGVVCFFCIRRCARDEYYREEAVRRQLRHQDMDELPIREGRTLHQPEGLLNPSSKFSIDDLDLDQKDKRFLKQGIPIAIAVNQRTFEADAAEALHIDLAPSLSSSGVSIVATVLDASAETPPSTLFQRSKSSSRPS